jgi:ATP-dependent HslUV protease ATP-binding subunit HslU
LRIQAEQAVEDRLISELIGAGSASDASFRELLRSGALDERNVEIELKPSSGDKSGKGGADATVVASGNLSELMGKFQELSKKQSQGGGAAGEKKKMTVREARPLIEEEELEKLMESVDVTKAALKAVEESGIVFIDEIDKICVASGKYRGADASAEGVQRDLLPLIEGCVINTKHGDVKTDYILFIASGAFHTCKPSDLLAELQGRLPIKVTLEGLSEDDMYRILTEPVTNLMAQQVELMATEGVTLVIEDEAIREVAAVASKANKLLENIGARRLHTIVERVMESLSFEAADLPPGSTVVVTKDLVTEKVSSMLTEKDLSKFIL